MSNLRAVGGREGRGDGGIDTNEHSIETEFFFCTRSPDTWLGTVAFNYRFDFFSLLKFYVI